MELKLTLKKNLPQIMTHGFVIVAFIIMQSLSSAGMLTRSVSGYLVPICVYIVLAVSLNLVVGISGELSLGHAGFMGVGAFAGVVAAACLQNTVDNDLLRLVLAMAVGGIFAGFAGVIIGIPVLRLRGDYLAIVTLAFGEILKNIVGNMYIGIDAEGMHFALDAADLHLLDGGKMVLSGPLGATGIQRISTFFAGFLLILFTLFVVLNLIRSRSGRAIMAIRDNKIAAEACGLDVTKYRMMAFVTSAALAGMGGALFGQNYSTLAPSNFSFNASILILVYVVLGGIGNITGSIIAATVLYVLPEELRAFSDYRMLVYAVVLIAVMLLTNNVAIKNFLASLRGKGSEKSERKDGEAV